ncbi:fumarylacetoacetate hydrolase family protein [Acrocarpospora macrocephala]|uniref:2-hydroxyhepta-2,4-diene-1,7-dioate isomerase n=1 Tax=Acrocarpospora macrocephala TaxID=150177 RepID=A0A5M3WLZ9_9ACTN|nr:fumarylacetoacetate hydrolase family protein [Acrocarpospora macrocephala]GES09656.1 2-hydroxyhepta-2,4-diene-1,7-dioate isomerase [Acrocarpospora macrocephala]
MRLATIRTAEGTSAVRLEGDRHLHLGFPDVGALLADPGWPDLAQTPDVTSSPASGADFAPVVPRPAKIICVGHNYTGHIREMGRELPEYPTLFTKFADSLLGAHDDIAKPSETEALDWEVELAVVIGRSVRRADEAEAVAAIAGFTVMNDISVRDWQFRTIEWTQGKIWDSSTPLGPYLVTPDELDGGVRPDLMVRTLVGGEAMQEDRTGTLLFNPVDLVRYVSTIVRLNPGDIIATGTPAGVGHAREPRRYLNDGDVVATHIEGIGGCRNLIVGARP